MSLKCAFCALLCILLAACDGGTPAGMRAILTLKSSHTLSPNEDYDSGVFCRLFYHPERGKFYLTFGAVITGGDINNFSDQRYAWREYDADLNYTGSTGVFDQTYAGDYAIAFDGTYYYLLVVSAQGQYRLTKYNSTFQSQGSVTVDWDINDEAGNDQLLNYTNGKLYFATLYDTEGTGPNYYTGTHVGTTYPHMFVYNTDLTEAESPAYLTAESNIPSGGSIVVEDGISTIVTADRIEGHNLSAYAYDADWNYLGKTDLGIRGSWSQGLVSEDGLFYVAFHTGHLVNGNLYAAIYDDDWELITSEALTDYSSSYNAMRPWITKVGNLLYISYDVASYDVANRQEVKDWQCHVDVYEVGS